MKNKKKIMILTLIVSIIVLIFSLTYVFFINKNTDKTELEIQRIKNLGKKSYKEIIQKVKDLGLEFKEED